MQTLLQIIEDCTSELGIFPQPSVVVGNTDQQIIQLLSLANRVGKDLVRDYEWRRLDKEYVFETTAAIVLTGNISAAGVITGLSSTTSLSVGMVVFAVGVQTWSEIESIDSATQVTLNLTATAGNSISCSFQTQDYALPSDYDRMISQTQWDRTNFWPNSGSKSSQQWANLKGGVLATGPRLRYRLYQNVLRFTPPPTEVWTESFEYISNYWVLPTGVTTPTKAKFTLDTDTCIFNDDLMTNGIKFQWKKTKGLDFSTELAEFGRSLSYSKAQDIPPQYTSLSPQPTPALITTQQIPETGFGT